MHEILRGLRDNAMKSPLKNKGNSRRVSSNKFTRLFHSVFRPFSDKEATPQGIAVV